MYNYYKYKGRHNMIDNKDSVSFRKVVPCFNSFHSITWHIMSIIRGGIFYEYQILKNGVIVSTAQVCPRLPIFPFIPKGGWHIGPCQTVKEERGKGYYPLLLQYIINEHPNRAYYMIVDNNNIPSQRGIAKLNFEKFAEGYKDSFGRYVIKK